MRRSAQVTLVGFFLILLTGCKGLFAWNIVAVISQFAKCVRVRTFHAHGNRFVGGWL